MVKRIALVVAGLMVLALAGTATANDKVRLGLLTPLSGPLAMGGEQAKNGLTLAIEKKGTLFGKEIELVIADAPDATKAKSNMERLYDTENLTIVFGGYGSSLEAAWQRVAQDQKKLCLGTVNWADKLTEGGNPYYFRYAATVSSLARELVNFLNEAGPKYLKKGPKDLKVIVVHSDQTSDVAKPAIEFLKGDGYVNVDTQSYPSSTSDFNSLLMKIRAANPDVLILYQYSADGLAFRRQMASMNFEAPLTIGGGLIYDQPEFASLPKDVADGCMSVSFTNPAMNPEVAPGLAEFKEKYIQRFGHVPLTHALIAYAAGLAYLEAIEQAGSLDVEKVRETLKNFEIKQGVGPAYWGCKFNEKGQNVLATPAVIAQWKQGVYTVVHPANFATGTMELPLKPFKDRK